jgi:hypothetical protein
MWYPSLVLTSTPDDPNTVIHAQKDHNAEQNRTEASTSTCVSPYPPPSTSTLVGSTSDQDEKKSSRESSARGSRSSVSLSRSSSSMRARKRSNTVVYESSPPDDESMHSSEGNEPNDHHEAPVEISSSASGMAQDRSTVQEDPIVPKDEPFEHNISSTIPRPPSVSCKREDGEVDSVKSEEDDHSMRLRYPEEDCISEDDDMCIQEDQAVRDVPVSVPEAAAVVVQEITNFSTDVSGHRPLLVVKTESWLYPAWPPKDET